MNVIVFGATGMIGQGVLRECLLAPDVNRVLTIGRTATGVQNAKLQDLVHADLWNYSAIEEQLRGFDACFFCLGVTSAGMSEADYTRVTYGITVAAAEMLCRLNPDMTFVFVSGAGADSTERGRIMWARVKGKTENALLALGFKATYMFRPGYIQPIGDVQSKTGWVQTAYDIARPLYPLIHRLLPNNSTTTSVLGRAMIQVAAAGYSKHVLYSADFNTLAAMR